ncbi:MAG: hypothetical protein ACJ77A_15600 [Actinomycetota bacterium]
MRWPRSRVALRLAVFAGLLLAVLAVPLAASAQVTIGPTDVITKETGGWVYWMAEGAIILGGAVLLFLGAMYLRFAPRFQHQEEEAPRAGRPGRPGPETAVVLQRSWQQATPPAGVQAVPAPQPVAVAAPAAPAAAPAPAAPVGAPAPGGAAPAAAAPAAAAPAAAAAEPAAPAPAAPRPREPVQLDQETFDRVLAEETAKGTSQRVAEGRARSAAVKAWRAKTGNE